MKSKYYKYLIIMTKRNYTRRNKTILRPQVHTEISLKIEDFKSNFHKCFISCAAECPDNIYFIQSSDKHNQ
jgi:hypothetical protein